MDTPRMFVVQSLQQARKATFAGPKYEPWLRPGVHSLPPPPDKPKKAVKAKPLSSTPMAERANVELITTPAGKQKWTLKTTVITEVRARLLAGGTAKAIASALNLPLSTISRISLAMRKETALTTTVAAEKEKDTEVPLSFVQPMPCLTPPDRAKPYPTSPAEPCQTAPCLTPPDPTQPYLPYPAIAESKADEPAIPDTCGPQQGYQEPPRVFILDWGKRMDAYSFSNPPTGCLPRKVPKRVSGMTRHQMRDELRAHGVTAPLAINCAAPGQQPARTSTKSPRKPLKTRYLDKKVVGEKGVDVEFQWREICMT